VTLNNETTVCLQCREPLTEIDNYGKRLIGCVECNRWTTQGSEHVTMQLPEEDIEALRYWRAAMKL
jgi:hypothetical protein